MSLAMKAQQMRLVHFGVALCCRQAGMAKQFLNGTKIGSVSKKMRGKGVAKRMRRDMRRKVEFKPQ